MEQVYSHHHMVHAHHNGIIIGTVAGSCAVTLLAAVAVITASPKLIFHPLSLTSQVTVQPDNSQIAQPGTGASQLSSVFPETHGSAGAGRALSQEFSH